MKKVLIVVLVLVLIFAVIRITTSTYENITRGRDSQMMSLHGCGRATDF